jgi:hypothetical protein
MVDLADKAGILGELWINFRDDEDFSNFIEYNDIGLPLAYYVAEGLVKEISPLGEQYIVESFEMFIQAIELTEEEIESFDEITLPALLAESHIKKNTIE